MPLLFLRGTLLPCVAVFVDAGYLFAQGSAAITGSAKPRSELALDKKAAVEAIFTTISAICSSTPLLRIYWYDAPPSAGRLSIEQADLALTNHVKLRLGQINSFGQQKEVDSLIVTDLIELARNRSISDAILLSGDVDLRIGVVIAQSLGVRVHILGISPSRGSQALALLQEADTTSEWDEAMVAKFLSHKPQYQTLQTLPSQPVSSPANSGATVAFEHICREILQALNDIDVELMRSYLDQQKGVPPEIDRQLLPRCGSELGRVLDEKEKRMVRRLLADAFKTMYPKK